MARFMRPDDWGCVRIERNRYFNKECPIIGYARTDGVGGNPLHSACALNNSLAETHQRFRMTYQDANISRRHVKMPYWSWEGQNLPENYSFVGAPERLTTTSITIVLVSRAQIQAAEMGFYYDGTTLPTLRERMKGASYRGLVGNLGYFMTSDLIGEKFPWSHNVRYPEFSLPITLSYLGFHLFKDDGGEVYGSFQGAHPAAVGIRESGEVDVIPRLEIEKYRVTLWGEEFSVSSINNPDAVEKVMLFTPGLWTPEVSAHVESWKTYAPEIPVPGRVNVFIANEGNGKVPVEKVVKVWEGRSPLPSFGAILSFETNYFDKLFASYLERDERIKIEPLGGVNFDAYAQMLGGLVPVVVGGQHVYCVETAEQVVERLRDYGNATSPIARCGRESRNFDLRVREPAGVLIQTDDRIGWVLFDGRRELSIGASVVDVAQILKLLEDDGAFGGKIRQAVFVDGGSAMKAYAVESDGATTTLDLLNRVAAGSRNGLDADPDGLNLYTLLKLSL